MKLPKIFVAGAFAGTLAIVAGCAGSPNQAPQSSANSPLIYLSSARPPLDIEHCLMRRVSQARIAQNGAAPTLLVGPYSADEDWTVTLTPISEAGTTVGVYRPRSGSGEPDEAALRFQIARCVI